MKIMGLSDSAYLLSWFMQYFITVLIISVIATRKPSYRHLLVLLSINIFVKCEMSLLFTYLFLYGLANFSSALIIT